MKQMLFSNETDTMKIQNNCIRIEIDDKSGILAGLYDKRCSAQYIASRTDNLFTITCPLNDWPGHQIVSAGQQFSLTRQGEDAVELFYPFLKTGRGRFAITVNIRAWLNADEVHLQMEVNNQSDRDLPVVQFPHVGGITEIQDRRTDLIYVANLGEPPKRLWTEPSGIYVSPASYSYLYPSYGTITAWFDISGKDRGLGLDIREKDFQCQGLFLRQFQSPGSKNFPWLFGWEYNPHIQPGETWRSSIIRLTLHKGDWHVLADRHRQAVMKHIEQPTAPEKLKSGLGWYQPYLRLGDGTNRFTYDDLPRLARKCKKIGFNYMTVCGWHAAGFDVLYPDYKPVPEWGGAARLRKVIQEVKRLGVNLVFYLNPTIWDMASASYRKLGRGQEIINRVGVNKKEYWGGPAGHRYEFAVMCPTKQVNDFQLKLASSLMRDCGMESFHLDQIGYRSFCCYAKGHRHSKPQFAATQGYQDFFSRLRIMLRRKNPDSIITTEGTSEFHGQWADTYWTVVILQAPHVRYLCPWLRCSTAITPGDFRLANLAFVYNVLLLLQAHNNLSGHRQFYAHLEKLAALKRKIWKCYADKPFQDENGIEYDGESVVAKVYADKDGWTVLTANLTDKPAQVSLRVSLPGAIEIFSSRNGRKTSPGKKNLRLKFRPYEVKALIGRTGGKDYLSLV